MIAISRYIYIYIFCTQRCCSLYDIQICAPCIKPDTDSNVPYIFYRSGTTVFEGGFRLVEEDEFMLSSDEEEDTDCNDSATSNNLSQSSNKFMKNDRMRKCNSNGFRIISNVLEISPDVSTSISMSILCIVPCLNC